VGKGEEEINPVAEEKKGLVCQPGESRMANKRGGQEEKRRDVRGKKQQRLKVKKKGDNRGQK